MNVSLSFSNSKTLTLSLKLPKVPQKKSLPHNNHHLIHHPNLKKNLPIELSNLSTPFHLVTSAPLSPATSPLPVASLQTVNAAVVPPRPLPPPSTPKEDLLRLPVDPDSPNTLLERRLTLSKRKSKPPSIPQSRLPGPPFQKQRIHPLQLHQQTSHSSASTLPSPLYFPLYQPLLPSPAYP